MADAKVLSNEEVASKLEKLKKDHRMLAERSIRVKAERERLEEDLEAARKKAIEQFGTADLNALRELLKQRKAENSSKVLGCEAALAELKRQLDAIEKGA